MNNHDTIVAAATPYGHGGVAVVRLSGNASKKVVEKLIVLKKPLENRHPTNVDLVDGAGNRFDSALITFFKSPSSYTGEDVLEISCHGSPAIVDTILDSCCKNGARIAEPGEFTRRAFLNGKIDLIQAEAVAGLINSNSTACTVLNHRILSGELSVRLNKIKDDIVHALSYSEFELDISEEEPMPDTIKLIQNKLTLAQKSLYTLLSSYREGRLINKGVSVVIAGRPNVGKSTLYNTLLNENKAIVNKAPGTTRDTLESSFILEGLTINLFDTAGIREGSSEVEKEGIERAHKTTESADVVLLVDDNDPAGTVKTDNIKTVFIRSKADLVSKQKQNNVNGRLYVSAKTGLGIESLKKEIKNIVGVSGSPSDNIYITTQRQKSAVESSLAFLNNALELLNNTAPELELVSLETREALNSIDDLLGKTTADDILNTVFSGFCVGK